LFTEALRPGTYLRLVAEGTVGSGDEIRVLERPTHGLTIRDVFRIYTRDRDDVARLLTVPRMSESWKRWAVDWLQKSRSQPTEAADPGCWESWAARVKNGERGADDGSSIATRGPDRPPGLAQASPVRAGPGERPARVDRPGSGQCPCGAFRGTRPARL